MTRNTSTKKIQNKGSTNKNTIAKKPKYKPITNRSNSNRNKRQTLSTSKKSIKRPIPNKTRSPKINRSVTKQVMKPKQIDYAILFTVIMLVIFGIVMVFSSSYYYAMTDPDFNDKYFFIVRQVRFAVLGSATMIFMTFFDYRKLKKYSIILYIAINILLILVLILSADTNGSKRWLFGFQPSEVAKISIIIFMAYIIDENPKIVTTWQGFLTCMIFIGIPSGIIAIENLSTAIVVAGVGVTMLFIAGVKITYFLPMVIPIGAAGAFLLLNEKYRYRMARITAWLDPFADPTDSGYQIVQSLFAIASGGLFGRGLGQSVQKLGYVPEPYNDIIFSIICEELGLIGAGAVILLFIILISRGIRVALKAKDLFASLLATGITSMIAIQAVINISVATNSIPNTGMSLPFISYGGSSLLILMASMGILLNISSYTKA